MKIFNKLKNRYFDKYQIRRIKEGLDVSIYL